MPFRHTFIGADEAIPAPTAPEQWTGEDFEGGYWMLVDIDLSKVSTKAVRINISMSEQLVHRIDGYASAHSMSRSAFLAAASERLMAETA
jgi:hypothetical protein